MNFEELLDLAGDDPILKEEIERAKTKDLDTFCIRIANDQIKDYRPYLYDESKLEHRIKMAEAQICVDELLDLEFGLDELELIPILIKNKKARVYYKNIALRGEPLDQYSLAQLGLFPKILINSDDEYTVYETLKNSPHILPKALDMMTSKDTMAGIIELYFEELPDPSLYYLEKFLKHPINKGRYKTLRQKYKALTAIPNTIEKTMTPYQLYQSQNILWACSLPAKIIEFMTRAEKEISSISETDFNEICRCKNNLAFHSFLTNRKD
jgi:hypothetical protein